MVRPRIHHGAEPGTAEYYRERYAANKDRYSAASNERQLNKKLASLGISRERYEHEMALGCAICGALDSGKKRLHIDHDHESNRYRGILCSNCNSTLGLMGDDVARLAQAIEYLANFARNAAKWHH